MNLRSARRTIGGHHQKFSARLIWSSIWILARLVPSIGCRQRRIYTKANDRLHQPWRGLVFMNPPFGGRNGHVPWLVKFLDHANGIAVVRSYTSSGWFHQHVVPRAELDPAYSYEAL